MNRLRFGDVVIASPPGAVITKRRPTVVMSSSAYLDTRPDVLLGILTTQIQAAKTAFDHVILDWQAANLRRACMYRSYFGTVPQGSVQPIGRLSARDIEAVRHCLAAAIG